MLVCHFLVQEQWEKQFHIYRFFGKSCRSWSDAMLWSTWSGVTTDSFSLLCPVCQNLEGPVSPSHAEYIKMPHPFLISSQSDYLIQVFDRNSHDNLMINSADPDQLASSADLDLHCLLKQDKTWLAREGLIYFYHFSIVMEISGQAPLRYSNPIV